MTTSLVGHFDQVSKKLGKNCGFFVNSIFLGHASILGVHTVCHTFLNVTFRVTGLPRSPFRRSGQALTTTNRLLDDRLQDDQIRNEPYCLGKNAINL